MDTEPGPRARTMAAIRAHTSPSGTKACEAERQPESNNCKPPSGAGPSNCAPVRPPRMVSKRLTTNCESLAMCKGLGTVRAMANAAASALPEVASLPTKGARLALRARGCCA
eukprot:7329872-Alexandrium_andersonii.AAC.1